jgi:hypothetical protein
LFSDNAGLPPYLLAITLRCRSKYGRRGSALALCVDRVAEHVDAENLGPRAQS